MKSFLALFLAVVLPAMADTPLLLRTEQGLSLAFSNEGDITNLVADSVTVPLNSQLGGFYIADVAKISAEMVNNGSLEEDTNGDGVPDGFFSGPYWARDNTVAHTGQWSMRCQVPGTNDMISGSFRVGVPVKGATTYLLSFWLKCQGRSGYYPASCGYAEERDGAGKLTTDVAQYNMSGSVSGDSNWTRIVLLLNTKSATRQIRFRTDIYRGHGTIWADDFSLIQVGEVPKHLPTAASDNAGTVVLRGLDETRSLRVEATWKAAGEMLMLVGRISDTSGKDRCLVVSYRVPLDATGGTWGNDIANAITIPPADRCAQVAKWGDFGPYSIYPFSSVLTKDNSVGLSMAVPMHPAQPFRLAYSATEGLLVEWDLALTPITQRFPQSAEFFALLYAHDPKWGFRAAAQKYYELFPAYFAVRCKRQGNWYCHDLSKLSQPEDFGLMFNEMSSPGAISADHKRGYLSFAYTEPWGWWGKNLGLTVPDNGSPIGKMEVFKQICELATNVPPEMSLQKQKVSRTAQSVLNSGILNAEGEPTTAGYVARWGGYNWALNPAPDAVSTNLFSRFKATYLWEIESPLTRNADGIYLDSIGHSWTTIPNYRPEHLSRANYPLTFSLVERRPTQLGIWNQYEFVEHLSLDLHTRGKLLMANMFPFNWVFYSHWIDVLGHEVWGPDDPLKLRAERTLAYHKPYTWLMQLKEDVSAGDREKSMRQAMSYGILPNIVGGTTDTNQYERFRPLFKKYMPAIILMAEAGWEPVTHATAGPGICVERFGPSQDRLFFSLRNDGKAPMSFGLSVDWSALGLLPQSTATRLPEGDQLTMQTNQFRLQLDPEQVIVLKLGATLQGKKPTAPQKLQLTPN